MTNFCFAFTTKLWMYQGKGAWFFVTLPKEESDQIKLISSYRRRGWGAVRVKAKIGETHWGTSVFPDSKAGAYLLPIKAEVRKKEKIDAGDIITVELEVRT